MANPSLLGLAVPFAPVTPAGGAPVALVVALVLGLVGSASAWYALWVRLVAGVASCLGRYGEVTPIPAVTCIVACGGHS
jgi:hypothetical protein